MPDVEKPDFQTVLARAQDVWTLFVCLQEVGFNEMQALALMQPCMIIGVPWKQELAQ